MSANESLGSRIRESHFINYRTSFGRYLIRFAEDIAPENLLARQIANPNALAATVGTSPAFVEHRALRPVDLGKMGGSVTIRNGWKVIPGSRPSTPLHVPYTELVYFEQAAELVDGLKDTADVTLATVDSSLIPATPLSDIIDEVTLHEVIEITNHAMSGNEADTFPVNSRFSPTEG